jgi:cytoskeleton protein RodZ
MNQASQDDQQLDLPHLDLPLGLRLRRAREQAGLGVADVAAKLKLKTATIEALEKEDLDLLGAAIYVRGYYNSYARLVGVPTVLVDGLFAERPAPAPQLQTTARVSHSRYLFDRYAKRAVYVVLTASIVVPVIFLATQDRLPRPGASLTPLDAPSIVSVNGPASEVDSSAQVSAVDPASPAPIQVERPTRSAGETPVIASLGPFYSPPSPPGAAPVAPTTVTGLSLHLRGDSWVEVLDRSGRRIEHGVLRAGQVREFDPAVVGKVSIGNADAVEVRMNGSETDIAAYRRANVARFTVSSDGSLAPAGG